MCLDRLSLASGASVLDRLKVPYIYCWSSTLIPKPNDWKQHIGQADGWINENAVLTHRGIHRPHWLSIPGNSGV